MNRIDPVRIKIPYPVNKEIHLKISTGAAELVIAPGIGNDLVTGKYYDPSDLAPVYIDQDGNDTHLRIGNALGYRLPSRSIPKLALSIGRKKPFSLSISTGDRSNNFNFGGLPLSSLAIKFGAGEQIVNFSYANPIPMSRMKVEAEGCSVQIENIVNANPAEIILAGDSAHFGLDFSGILKQNTYVCIRTAMSHVQVGVPSTTATKISTEYLHASKALDDFVFQDNAYWNTPARGNHDSLLHIHDMTTVTSFQWRFLGE